jgi:hypothetical protein
MPKRTLVEAGMFSKLLSAFYDKKSKGQEDDITNILKKKTNNPAYDKAYNAWKNDSEKLLLATKKMLQQSGLSTADVDNLLKKYHS